SRHLRGEELWMDHVDGIRQETSIGYMIHEIKELKPEELDEELKNLALRTKLPVYRVTDWEPLEASSVSIPADITVGVGRSLEDFFRGKELQITPVPEQVGSGKDPQGQIQSQSQKKEVRMEDPKNTEPTPEEVRAQERERISAITAIAKKFVGRIDKIDEVRDTAIKTNDTVEKFKGDIAMRLADDPNPIFSPDSKLDMGKKEQKQYSLLRLIQSAHEGSRVDAAFERECSNEIAKRLGTPPKGFYIPWDIQNRAHDSQLPDGFVREFEALKSKYGQRTVMDSSNATYAANLIGTDLRADMFVEMLRNRAVCGRAGVTLLTGLVGSVDIPKQSTAGTFAWSAESGQTSVSNLTVGKISLTPKEGRAYQEYYRKLLLQSTPSIEALVQRDLLMIATLGVDAGVFHGAGTNEPDGIAIESGIGSVDAANIGWEQVVEFETDVATANGDVDTMFYITNPTVRGLLKTRPMFINSPNPIMGIDQMVNGYKSIISNQISSGYMFFGDFTQEILAYWGTMDLLVNPYIKSDYGITQIHVFVDVDAGLRQAGAISMASNVS
ncbi:MAG: phage major capsid protein, partial [Phycisphaerae bacterium]